MRSGDVIQLPGFGAASSEKPPSVYFSGPLTWYAKEDPAKYQQVLELGALVEQALESRGFSVHVPHRERHDDEERTYLINRLIIARSELVVAYYDYPSTGMGQELDIAAAYSRPVILLIKERRGNVSTMITSAFFASARIEFDDPAEIAEQLPDLAEAVARPAIVGSLAGELGTAVRRERESLGMTQAILASSAGCSEALVRHLEQDEPGVINPTLHQVEQLAAALDTNAESLLGLTQSRSSFERRVIEFAAHENRPSKEALDVLQAAAREDSEFDDSDAAIARLFELARTYTGNDNPQR